jgi:RNA polymerase sigma-70 factor (ECF subfamily)
MVAGRVARESLSVAKDEAQHESGSDEALAVRCDADALVLLYRRYLTPVYRYLYARTGNTEEAEDITALTWERVLESLPHYRPTAPFRAWLFTLARRALADHYRRRPGSRAPYVSLESVADTLADEGAGPEEQAIALDDSAHALNALAQLGEEQQEVLTLRFMGGLSYAEIAQIVGKSEPAAKMMAYRALAELRRLMKV